MGSGVGIGGGGDSLSNVLFWRRLPFYKLVLDLFSFFVRQVAQKSKWRSKPAKSGRLEQRKIDLEVVLSRQHHCIDPV
jgi:hypothetical protein